MIQMLQAGCRYMTKNKTANDSMPTYIAKSDYRIHAMTTVYIWK